MSTPAVHNPPEFIVEAASVIESQLDESLRSFSLPPNLYEAAQYAVMNGGKRVRPALTLLCAQAVGGTQDQAMAAALAVEFIHCFSLVHDDLPAIDNDDIRRGKPTLHVHAGEAMAVLAGDLLLPLAFLQLTRGDYSAIQQVALMKELADATRKMVIGQIFDTVGGLPSHLNKKEALQEIHQNKTGALIKCACTLGGICGDATPEALQAIEAYGEATGLMYQIVDDLIDLHGKSDYVGKATGKDADAGKTTYPSTIGVEESKKAIEQLRLQADSSLITIGVHGETLRSFNLWMAHRTR